MMEIKICSYFIATRHLTLSAKALCLASLALLGMSFCAMHANAQVTNTVVADFTDGNTTTAVDGFEGMAGDGWYGPWIVTDKTNETSSVVGVQPGTGGLYPEVSSGSGNYLNIQLSSTTAEEDARITVGRDFRDGIDLTKNHTMGFTVRINEVDIEDQLYSYMDHKRDYYMITSSDKSRSGTYSRDVFQVIASGTDESWGAEAEKKWAFVNGDKNGGSLGYVGSEMPLVQGGIYDFTFFIDTQNFTYNVTLDNGTTSYSMNDLGWVTNKAYASNFLNFIASCDTNLETRDMSIDNFYIEQTLLPLGGMTEIVANFNDGNTATVNGFTGAPGNGWKTGWIVSERDDPILDAAVMTSGDEGYQELHPGDGNYLKLNLGSEDTENPAARTGISRSYETEPGIDYTQNHTIEFTVRIDENMDTENGSTMTGTKDRYGISCSHTANTYPGSNDRFAIVAAGNDEDWGVEAVRQWAFIDGDHDGDTSNDTTISSGIPLIEGGVYDFTVFINVDEFSCDITIDDGTTSFTAGDLGWLTSATDVGAFLNFMATCDGTDDLRAMSIDNIRIAQAAAVKIPGDANDDGKVDGSDVTILANNWQAGVGGGGGATWDMGDFNGDGKVDGSDVTILANNWQYGVTTAAASVPEPGTILLLLSACLVILPHWIRRKR